MKKECEMASWWWTQQLNRGVAGQSSSNNPPLGFETLSIFQKNLQEMMETKYENHWYPHQPDRGHAYRSIMCDRRVIDNLLLMAAAKAHISLRERLDTELIMWVDPGCVKIQYSHSPKSPHIIYQAPTSATSDEELAGVSTKGKSFSVPNSPTILSIRSKSSLLSSPPTTSNSPSTSTPIAGTDSNNTSVYPPPRPASTTPTKLKSSSNINTLRASLVNTLHSTYYPERSRSPNHHNNTLFVPNYQQQPSYSYNNNNNSSPFISGQVYNNNNLYDRPTFNNNTVVFHSNNTSPAGANGFTQPSDSFTTTVVQ